jgi:4-hydroxy-3-methylbut-2-enyl diphosphate reductase
MSLDIVLAKSAGFCFGVKRATKMAFEAVETHDHLCSLGPIIHSPQVVEMLSDQGVEVFNDVQDIPQGAVIIRSHGVSAEEMSRILDRDLIVVDATCPFVKKAQEDVARLSSEGYSIVIVGELEHPEVQGIVSYADSKRAYVVANVNEVSNLPRMNRIGIVAQTTQSIENLREVVSACLVRCQEIRVYNTICDATLVRQNEASAIARQVDLMLVIGGYNSANTTRLAQICKEIQPETYHIETAGDIDSGWFNGTGKVGITAGASTPRWLIDEVVSRVASYGK